MKRTSIFTMSLLGIITYAGILFWVGRSFATYYLGTETFSVESVDRIQGKSADHDELLISGTGFNKKTRVVLSADIGNRRALQNNVPLWGAANRLVRVDDQLLVANSQLGLQVLDAKNLSHPVVTRTIRIDSKPVDIYTDKNRIFLSCTRSGVVVFEQDEHGVIETQGSVQVEGTVLSSRVDGNTLYVATGEGGVKIYDISSLSRSARFYEKISQIQTPGKALSLTLHGEVLFIGTNSGLLVYSVADLNHPKLIENILQDKSISALKLYDDLLYVAHKKGTLSTYDVSDGFKPDLLGDIFIGGSVQDIFPLEDRIYLADSIKGLVVLGRGSPDKLNVEGIIDVPGQALSVVVHGEIAYVTSNSRGLQLVDLKKISAPQVLSSVRTSGRVTDLEYAGDFLYVSDFSGLHIIERNGRDSMSIVSSLPSLDNVWDIEKYGKYLCMAEGRKGVSLVDVSDPRNPRRISQLELPGIARNISISGDRLIVGAKKKGAHIVELMNSHELRLVETLKDSKNVGDVLLDREFLYVSSVLGGVYIYTLVDGKKAALISEIVRPWPLDHFNLSLGLAMKDGWLYVAAGRNGLQIIDVRDPYQPEIVRTLPFPAYVVDVEIFENMAFITSPQDSTYMVDITDPRKAQNLGQVVPKKAIRGIQKTADSLLVGNGVEGILEIVLPQELSDVRVEDSEHLRMSVPKLSSKGWYNVNVSTLNKQETRHGVLTSAAD